MLRSLTTPAQVNSAHADIVALLREYAEWLFVADCMTQPLRRDEIDVVVAQERLMFSCWTERGTRLWRVAAWDWNGQLLELEVSRKLRADVSLIQLIPRTSAKAITATIRVARQLRCERLAQLATTLQIGSVVERLSLSRGTKPGQPGRYAQVLLKTRRARIAVAAPIVSSPPSAVDAFLSSSLLWFRRTCDRVKPPYVEQLWLIISPELLKPLLFRLALLRSSLRDIIKVFTIDEDLTVLTDSPCPEKEDLWRKKLARFPPVAAATASELSLAILAEAPQAIDIVHSRHGETLRYFGLPFARVRSLLGREKLWFGINRAHRQLLDDSTINDWHNLLRDLREHRSAGSVAGVAVAPRHNQTRSGFDHRATARTVSHRTRREAWYQAHRPAGPATGWTSGCDRIESLRRS
jgi:hypothetical protein